jgi:hypothetical protein
VSDKVKEVRNVIEEQISDDIPDKIDIPFFELDNTDDTKIVSNLK